MHFLPPSSTLSAWARVVGPLTPLQQQLLLAGGGGGGDGLEASAALAETAASLGLQGILPDDAHRGGGDAQPMTGNTDGGTLVARLSGEVDSDDEAEARAVMREREEVEEEEAERGGKKDRAGAFVGALLQVGPRRRRLEGMEASCGHPLPPHRRTEVRWHLPSRRTISSSTSSTT